MAKRFQTYEVEGEESPFYFEFIASNGEPVFESQGYTTKQAMRKGINAARECADAPIRRVKKKSAAIG